MTSLAFLSLSSPRSLRLSQTLAFSSKPTQSTLSPPPPPPSKKSLAVATGEMFLGIASRIIRARTSGSIEVTMFRDTDERGRVIGRERGEVTAEVVDPLGVVWEQRERDVEAERERKVMTSPGFSFSAAGLLFPYHLGVARFLIEKGYIKLGVAQLLIEKGYIKVKSTEKGYIKLGVAQLLIEKGYIKVKSTEKGYIKDTTPLAGASAGAIVCAVIASGASMEEALRATKILAEDCRTKGTAFRLGAVLREILVDFLPDDVHIRSNGRVRVAVTQLLWKPRGLLVDQFDSKEDLINAVFTSSFIPGYLAPRPATMFRNRLCIDGGLTLFMPPTSASQTVRVCAFPTNQLGLEGIGISPDCNPLNRATPRELLNWALEPAEDLILDRMFELGYLDAEVWGNNNPVDGIVRDENLSSDNGTIA